MHKAINAKFKKGDDVYWDYTHGVVKGDDGHGRYLVRFDNYIADVWVIEKLLRTTRFKKGDKVYWDGVRGIITKDIGCGKYAVHFDGYAKDLCIRGDKLRWMPGAVKWGRMAEAEFAGRNATVANAKFNVGQLVKHKNGDTGVIEVVNPANGLGDYMVRIVAGHGGFSGKASWDEKDLSVANCSTANSVVAKAVANARAANSMPGEKFKVGQTVYYKDGPFQSLGTIEAVVGSKYKIKDYHTNRVIEMRGDDIAYAANSSAEPTVAKNGAADVLVSFTTITAKGLEKVQARMTESDFDVWAKKVGAGDTQNVYKELATSGKAGFAITRPLSVTVTQL
jgi:hypothetical protein